MGEYIYKTDRFCMYFIKNKIGSTLNNRSARTFLDILKKICYNISTIKIINNIKYIIMEEYIYVRQRKYSR